MSYLVGGGAFFVEGQPPPKDGQPSVTRDHVGYSYFASTGSRSFAGGRSRKATAVPAGGSPRIVRDIAQKFWPGQDPIGKRLRLAGRSAAGRDGVARDSKYVLVFEAPRRFISAHRARVDLRTLQVRAKGDRPAAAPNARSRR
jgi:hypothetical protein